MKLNYLIKRLRSLNYDKMLETVKIVSAKTGRFKLFVLLDIIYCGIKYQAGYIDYDLFQMYKMNKKERKTIVTRGINNQLIKFFNNSDYNHYFKNKNEFNEKFNSYLKREWFLIDNNYEEFEKFISNKKEIIVKPIDGMCGKKIEKINLKNKNIKELYKCLSNNKLYLLEEVIKQHKEMNKMYDKSVNTVRVITVTYNNNVSILAVYFRIGNGKIVDNFNSGGMVVPVNKKTGLIEYPALDKKGELYTTHPITKTPIIGFRIPLWEELTNLISNVALIIPEIRLIGWDVAITEKGPLLVEGNEFPGHDIYQLPPHRDGNIGLLPEFEKTLKEIGVTKKMLGL